MTFMIKKVEDEKQNGKLWGNMNFFQISSHIISVKSKFVICALYNNSRFQKQIDHLHISHNTLWIFCSTAIQLQTAQIVSLHIW